MNNHANVSAPDVALVNLVKARREQQGMSQGELASKMTSEGVRMSQSALSRIEQGDRALTVGEAQLAASLLGTTLEALLRSDPVDELIAELHASLRAATISRDNALSALQIHIQAMDRIEKILQTLQAAIDQTPSQSDDATRLLAAQERAFEKAPEFLSEKIEMTFAKAMDDLGTTTSYSETVERHYAQLNDG